jgi:hypothetical protein
MTSIDELLKAVRSPEADIERKRRAREIFENSSEHDRDQICRHISHDLIYAARDPLHQQRYWDYDERLRAEAEVKQNIEALMVRQIESHLRIADERAVYADPDYYEQQRIWSAYTAAVSSIAWREGSKTETFIARWRGLVDDRNAAVDSGTPTGSIDKRLERLIGTPFPQLPHAAWVAADLLPETERQVEYDRLTQKYGEREPESPAKSDRKIRLMSRRSVA